MKRARENGENGESGTTPPLPSVINAMSISDRVTSLRNLMSLHSIDAFLVPTDDAHMSEYCANCDQRREFITGFDGSAGTALITKTAAYCWVDGRYFVQAAKQLDPNVYQMMKMSDGLTMEEWCAKSLPNGTAIFVDGSTMSVRSIARFRAALVAPQPSSNITISVLPRDVPNLVDTVWSTARPASPASTIFLHPLQYSGVSMSTKTQAIRLKMAEKRASMLIVTGLDEVAWFLNLRASDVDFNPVFWAYVTITKDNVHLFVNSTRFAEDVTPYLEENNVTVYPYEALLKVLTNTCWEDNACVWLDPAVCNYAILHTLEKLPSPVQIIKKQSPIQLAKAKKCDVELNGMRACHLRDGVALAKFLAWLENEIVNNGATPTEAEVTNVLEKYRSEEDLFMGLSFPAISSVGANGAIVHYRPDPVTAARITTTEVYLIDSGGQYRDGTTDVTRTMHFGTPSKWQKHCFTRVLQGHIALDCAVFPKGTTGHLLDGFARRPLWKSGLDYKHGTGHGVGSFLNVHEGPHVISFKAQALGTALEPGFITSNEPGYYEENEFGIRIENLCAVVETDVKGPSNKDDKTFYTMEHLTLSPIQAKMIDVEMLSENERKWIDDYHKECYEKLSPLLKNDEATLSWLSANTEPLPL